MYTVKNVTSRVLPGRWTVRAGHGQPPVHVLRKLGLFGKTVKKIEFERNDRVVILLPDRYARALRRYRVFLAGWMRQDGKSSPFILTVFNGNPTLMFFGKSAGGQFDDVGSITIFGVPGKSVREDVLLIGDSGGKRHFLRMNRE